MCRFTLLWMIMMAIAGCEPTATPSLSSSTEAVAGTDRLNAGERLYPGEAIASGATSLVYQGDNNLVLYQNGSALWATMAGLGQPTDRFEMQTDCNAVVYAASGYVWASWTNGQGSACYARVIEGDWFICSGTTRVYSARGGGDCSGGGGTTLQSERVRLFDTWIARNQPGRERCSAWSSLSWSEKQVFLTITHRLSLYILARPTLCIGSFCTSSYNPQYAAGGTMLAHMRQLYAIRGFYSGTESCGVPPFCGGDHGDESRLFFSMDPDVYGAMALAYVWQIDDSGYQGWSRAPLITNVQGGVPFYDYFRNSHDAGGPHAPFDWSDESKGGRTDAPGSPTAQTQFWSASSSWQPWGGGSAQSPVYRPGVWGVTDPYMLEIDQDWDLCHHSDPASCDRGQEYSDHYGDYQPYWSPPCNGPVCGNAACEAGESCGSCPQDCGSCGGTSCGAMQANHGIWGVATVWNPVYQPDPGSCAAYCGQNFATVCEWSENGDCYAEFGGSPYWVDAGGWWAAMCY